MREVTLHITENKFSAFMEIAKSLNFVKKIETDKDETKENILSNIKTGLLEVKQFKK